MYRVDTFSAALTAASRVALSWRTEALGRGDLAFDVIIAFHTNLAIQGSLTQ